MVVVSVSVSGVPVVFQIETAESTVSSLPFVVGINGNSPHSVEDGLHSDVHGQCHFRHSYDRVVAVANSVNGDVVAAVVAAEPVVGELVFAAECVVTVESVELLGLLVIVAFGGE